VLKGEFEVSWNDDGAERATLRRFDTISFPPGVCRGFRNVGRGEGILQVIITGGVHDMSDIAFSRNAKRRIEAVRPGLAREFEKTGFRFDAAAR
jgi:quercetin dioxygenase-like cupin family protein